MSALFPEGEPQPFPELSTVIDQIAADLVRRGVFGSSGKIFLPNEEVADIPYGEVAETIRALSQNALFMREDGSFDEDSFYAAAFLFLYVKQKWPTITIEQNQPDFFMYGLMKRMPLVATKFILDAQMLPLGKSRIIRDIIALASDDSILQIAKLLEETNLRVERVEDTFFGFGLGKGNTPLEGTPVFPMLKAAETLLARHNRPGAQIVLEMIAARMLADLQRYPEHQASYLKKVGTRALAQIASLYFLLQPGEGRRSTKGNPIIQELFLTALGKELNRGTAGDIFAQLLRTSNTITIGLEKKESAETLALCLQRLPQELRTDIVNSQPSEMPNELQKILELLPTSAQLLEERIGQVLGNDQSMVRTQEDVAYMEKVSARINRDVVTTLTVHLVIIQRRNAIVERMQEFFNSQEVAKRVRGLASPDPFVRFMRSDFSPQEWLLRRILAHFNSSDSNRTS